MNEPQPLGAQNPQPSEQFDAAWDALRADTRITRCGGCGSWMFLDGYCDTCEWDRT